MIKDNLNRLEEAISETCYQSGRKRSDITLVAVSKTQPLPIIEEAYNLGLRYFGENKAQEFRDKTENFSYDVHWHFIGHLQTNKVKYVINSAALIHSADSEKLLSEIEKRSSAINKVQNILFEVNTSSELTKFGLKDEENTIKLAEFCKGLPHLSLKGLMTMAPFTDDETMIRNCFIKLRELKDRMNKLNFGLTDLSMGMTNDYRIAIEEGATILRIGTAIFGERKYLSK